METIIIILQILIFAFLIIAYFFMKNLLPSYFSEKGKNLATKEDVTEITEKIKTVETKIKIRESGEIDYNSLKRKAILDYFATLNNWQRTTTEYSVNHSSEHEIKNEIAIGKIKDAKSANNLKEGEIEIFISDKDFYDLRTKLTIKILKLQHEFEKHCLKIDYIIKSETILEKRRPLILDEIKAFQEIRLEKLNDLMPDRNALIKYLDNCIKESFK